MLPFQLAGLLVDSFQVLHKDRHGLERCLSTLLLHHETLGLLVTRDVAGHADAQE